MPISISAILQAAYPTVLDMKKAGFSFVSPSLRCRHRHGRIKVMSLGACVEVNHYNSQPTFYDISELVVPIIWTRAREIENYTETKRINLTKSLIDNAIRTHDDLLFQKIGHGQAVVSKEYRYSLGEVQEINECFLCKIYTAVAFLPRGSF